MRGRALRGRSPAASATSSSARPEPTSSSNRLAWLFSTVKRTSLSRITAHDQSEARARNTSTPFTTQSAARNRWTASKVSGVIGADESMRLLQGLGGPRMAQADG